MGGAGEKWPVFLACKGFHASPPVFPPGLFLSRTFVVGFSTTPSVQDGLTLVPSAKTFVRNKATF